MCLCGCACVSLYLIIVFSAFLHLLLGSNTPTNTVPTHLFVTHFELPVFAAIRLAVAERDGGNQARKEGTKERLTARVSGYSLMLTE